MSTNWNPHSNFGAADTDADYEREAWQDVNGRKWDTVGGTPIPLGHDREEDSRPAMAGRLETADRMEKFMLAGSATFTLVSLKTEGRYTYKVAKPADWNAASPIWFVSLLSGPDNTRDFSYMGLIRLREGSYQFVSTKGSKVQPGAPGYMAFAWFWKHLMAESDKLDQVEVWHEGRCGRCNRALTVPESIEQGFGPECINHVGERL